MQLATQFKVFIVDDSRLIRERVIDRLNALEGVALVGEADSPAMAIEGIAVTRPDAVVLDIHLADGDGIEVLEAFGAGVSEVVFIVLTSHTDRFYRRAYVEAGARYFLDKNSEFEKVAEIVAQLRDRGQ